jgi:hypothetical protein
MQVRVLSFPLRSALAGGAVVGFVAGFLAGSLFGAGLSWFAGLFLDWQRQLAFTLGVTEELLPLGEQQGLLQSVQTYWWIVVPACGILVGVLGALTGALGTALVAAVFNRMGQGAEMTVDVGPR